MRFAQTGRGSPSQPDGLRHAGKGERNDVALSLATNGFIVLCCYLDAHRRKTLAAFLLACVRQ